MRAGRVPPLMRRRHWFLAGALSVCLAAAASARGTPPAASPAPTPAIHSARLITLDDAYDIALATDQSIQIAYWEIRQANLLTWSALTKLGPQLNAGSSYSYAQTHAPGVIPYAETGALNVSYSQTFVDFSVFPAYRYGKLAAIAARLQHQYTIRQTLFGVASAYYQVLTDEGVVEVDAKTVDLAAQQLDVAQKRLNVGEVTPTDALTARAVVEADKVTLIQAKKTLLVDRDTLGNILNLGCDSGFTVALPPDYPTTIPPYEKLLAIGYRNREDLAVGNIGVGEDVAKKGEVIAEYAPQIFGNAGDSYTNSKGFYGPQSQVWDASIGVSLPIFTGGQREIDLKTAGEQVEVDKLNRDKIAKTVEGDVRSAWLNANSLRDSLVSLRVQVDAARESYTDLQHEYQAGTASSTDVLVGLNNLNTSENSLAVQVYAYQVALRDLEEAAGVFQQQRVQRVKVK